ncbi:hypothetical protein L486_06122 [Kwoniella mangroviensis CBS 10435]|uniref:Protein-tyrosine phosphatase n=1 Tax=Kwoniella mangroviensis CBS 10435 TaxID=1331196 RepID=A0A1B9ILA2_9TREE|nr:uncharacterized protein I203_05828 [Kwoniella mangroviensis CBS 8507]OCF56181.1 hypothetical protein L486_06122 [Kwoniella mangroviensis CBS 10435]OCF65086.1 hypothetical protein I203_05828 [Kwoniella mangroviensis CBS 8507]OCF78931.1 hypothetical protein I204_00875 [Kwoniella mangroviensis CBS 8886]
MPSVSLQQLRKVYDILAEREYIRLRTSQVPRPSAEQAFYSVRNSLSHRADNRYSNILAYDRTAVSVEGGYINANVVTDGKGGEWIAAQAPLPRTFDTFFRALYLGSATGRRSDNAILVQLTGWEERGMLKANPYMNHVMDHLPLKIENQQRRDEISCDVTEILLGADRPVKVHHYHFDSWPDHGVPQGRGVEALSKLVDEIQQRKDSLGCEVWVHCSAGVGRTGTFIALSSLRQPGLPKHSSPLGPLPEELSEDIVAHTVDVIRECRGILVQTPEQLGLVYEMQ